MGAERHDQARNDKAGRFDVRPAILRCAQ